MSAVNGKSQEAQKHRFDFAQQNTDQQMSVPMQDQQLSVPMPNGHIQSNNVLSGEQLLNIVQQNLQGDLSKRQLENQQMQLMVAQMQNNLQALNQSFERMHDEDTDSVIEYEFIVRGMGE